ncbi:MAG: hypothetical protein ACREN2_12290 [Candidatus Dormibacteria bacterium]
MSAPYFVVEGNDVESYADLKSVGAGLEAYDLARYRLFTSDGELLQLVKRGRGIGASDKVLGRDPEALARALYAALTSPVRKGLVRRRRQMGPDAKQLDGATLPELVAAFVRMEGSTTD